MRRFAYCALVLFLSTGLFAGSAAQAGIIVQYQFSGTPPEKPTTTSADLDLTTDMSITKGAGVSQWEMGTSAYGYASGPVLRMCTGSGANCTTVAASVSIDGYWTFTIKPAAGEVLNLDNLTFNVARGGGSTPRGWGLETSMDGFGASNVVQTASVLTQRTTWTPVSVDLSAAKFQGLSGPLTFRMYQYAPDGGNSLEYDDVTLNGTLTPEPATLALLGLGGLALSVRRRR